MASWTPIASLLALTLLRSASALALRSAASEELDPVIPQDVHKFTFKQGLIEREFYVHLGHILPSTDISVMFFYHSSGNGAHMWWLGREREGIRNLVQSGEFVAVYLQGSYNVWNLGAEGSHSDDLQYSEIVLDRLETELNLKFARIYAIGFSLGAAMVHQLMASSTVFAPRVAGLITMSCPILDGYYPHINVRAIPVVLLHGDGDFMVNVMGGPFYTAYGSHYLESEQQTLKIWAEHDACTEGPIERTDEHFTSYEWRSCRDGVATELIMMKGVQHEMPGTFDWFGVSWDFIESHSQVTARS